MPRLSGRAAALASVAKINWDIRPTLVTLLGVKTHPRRPVLVGIALAVLLALGAGSRSWSATRSASAANRPTSPPRRSSPCPDRDRAAAGVHRHHGARHRPTRSRGRRAPGRGRRGRDHRRRDHARRGGRRRPRRGRDVPARRRPRARCASRPRARRAPCAASTTSPRSARPARSVAEHLGETVDVAAAVPHGRHGRGRRRPRPGRVGGRQRLLAHLQGVRRRAPARGAVHRRGRARGARATSTSTSPLARQRLQRRRLPRLRRVRDVHGRRRRDASTRRRRRARRPGRSRCATRSARSGSTRTSSA